MPDARGKLFLPHVSVPYLVVCLKLGQYSYREVVKALSKLGFRAVRQKGSHVVLKGFFKEKKRTVVVPKHKEIAVGTPSRNSVSSRTCC